jgi:hypothetical protein
MSTHDKAEKARASCESHGIEWDCNKRWEKGVPHHPAAVAIFKLLEESDGLFGDDYFCWKSGGDGDNGESLMYSLSVLLELRDKEAASQ